MPSGLMVMVSNVACDEWGAIRFTGSWNDSITRGKVTARVTTRWPDPGTEVFEMHGPGAERHRE